MNQAIAFGHFALLLALLGIMVQLFSLAPGVEGGPLIFSIFLWAVAVVFIAMEWNALRRQQ